MKRRLKIPWMASLTISIGVIVLLGYFVDLPLLNTLRVVFLQWVMIVAAAALLIGVYNLGAVHGTRMIAREKGWLNSAVLLVALIGTLVLGFMFKSHGEVVVWLYRYIQVPTEVSLTALLAVLLIFAVSRMPARKPDLFSAVFFGTVLLIVIGSAASRFMSFPVLDAARGWLTRIPAVAGARGILLGVALGTVATALRVLLGGDRPYGG